MSNKYCALPFNHINVAPQGDYQICCKHPVPVEHRNNIKFTSPDEWQKNKYLNEIRRQFEQGQEPVGCNACWKQEQLDTKSLRQVQSQEYQLIGAKSFETKLLNVEISLGNLCNLSCIMCNEVYSSSILAENSRLRISQHLQEDFLWNEAAFEHFAKILASGPRVINLLGGEPLYNKKILDIIKQFPDKNLNKTMLHLTTNATRWNDEWQDQLKKFRLVRVMLSIDAVGELYEYIRYPAKFLQVEQNIKKITNCSNIKPVIHAVVQNLNITSIGKLIQWAQDHNIYLMLDLLTGPAHLQITNLPDHLKKQAIEHLEKTLKLDIAPHLQKSLSEYHDILKNTLDQPFDKVLWEKFVSSISIRDELRKNSHRDFLKY
jgi:molybdenum cofactor biosynthesis enzyme MoaA